MRYNPRPSSSALCLLLALVVIGVLIVDVSRSKAARGGKVSTEGAAARAAQSYGQLPLSFEPNRGQADARVGFVARNSAYSLYLTADEITFALRDTTKKEGLKEEAGRSDVLRIKLLGANGEPRGTGLEELAGKSNYLFGRDPSRWRTNVPNYGRVRYEGVYPGVDVVYYGTQRQLEYDFNVAPGADAGLIRMRVEGAREVRIDANGDLVLPTAAGEVRQRAPYAYQEIGGVRQTVACRYVLAGVDRVGFELGEYDRTRPLVIDPVVSYSTYLGGSGLDEATAIAVDSEGNAYVTGQTDSLDFPVTPNALQRTKRGAAEPFNSDAFVSKLTPDGSALVYSTYLGGSGVDIGTGIAVDGDGCAYVVGKTDSFTFPTTSGAFRTTRAGEEDVFVSKLNEDGTALLYSTYLGGSSYEGSAQVAVGSGGEVYVSGETSSSNFPITPGVFQPEPGGHTPNPWDGFVTKLTPEAGAGLTFSTFIGGSSGDSIQGLAVGADGSVYLAGSTVSNDFPVTPNAVQPALAGDGTTYDAFVMRLNSAGTAALFSTYFGGELHDFGWAIALDPQGAAYMTGPTFSAAFPTTPGAFRRSLSNPPNVPWVGDAFVAKFGADDGALVYSTYFGGSNNDEPKSIAVDGQGNAYVVGKSDSLEFPATPDAFQAGQGDGNNHGFFFKLNASGGAVPYATYIIGASDDIVRDVALGRDGEVYLTGTTASPNFPTTPSLRPNDIDVFEHDGFVMKFQFEPPTFKVSGRATAFGGAALSDVNVRVEGDYYSETVTDADGFYSFEGIPAGVSINLSANRFGATLVPVLAQFPNLQRDEELDFTGDPPFVIKGQVKNEAGIGLSVPVTITSEDGSLNLTVPTYDGHYYFVVPPRGNYTVTPGPDPASEFTFSPASKTFNNVRVDQTFDFLGQRPPRIFGRIEEGEYSYGLGSVRVTLTGPTLQTPLVQTTDSYGYFFFENLERGATYTVTPTDPETNRSFAPAELTVQNIQGWEFLSFTALRPLAIHGRVQDANQFGVSGIAKLTGTVNATTQVDEWGSFSFMNLPRGGDYTVTITKPGSLYTFEPPSRSVTNLQEMQFFEFEALPPLRIDGGITSEDGAVAGVTVTLSGAVNRTTITDENGVYHFTDLPRGGTYVVTPAHELYIFTPASQEFPALNGDRLAAAFNGELRRFTLRGRVADAGGASLAGASVLISGANFQEMRQTDENGNYAFDNLSVGRDYNVTAARLGYSFAPTVFNLHDPRGDRTADFTGSRLTYTLTGRVTDGAGGAGLAGATVSLNGSLTATAQTDAQGNYTFTGLPSEGNYNVSASHPHFAFEPAARSFNNLLADASGDFAGTRLKRQIRGRVTDTSGAALAGVTVTLGGASVSNTLTDSFGDYLFYDLPSGSDYTVTVAKTHYAFSPATRQFDGLGADATANFTGTLLKHKISGRVVDVNGNGFAGALVNLIGGGAVTTDATGNFAFNNLPAGGNYTVLPTRDFYNFSPSMGVFNDLGADQTVTFTATLRTASIGGRVTEGANGVAGVAISLSGTRTATAQTDASGNYVFTSLPANGTYTVTPAAGAVYTFAPASASFNGLHFNETANFSATRRLYQVTGSARDACGRALAGVTLSLTHDGVTVNAQTNAAGAYTFANVPAGYNYTLAPTGSAYTFTPSSIAFPALSANQTGNFTGRPPTATADAFALADLYVRGGNNAGSYFGTSSQLIARLASNAKDTHESYLKFNVGQPCTVASVKLRLYGKLSASGNLPVNVYGVPVTTWTETSTNWNNKPAAGALLRTVNVPGTTDAWYEWDVTDYVRAELAAGRTTVAFALKSTTTTSYQVTFNAREATGSNAPRLVITTP